MPMLKQEREVKVALDPGPAEKSSVLSLDRNPWNDFMSDRGGGTITDS